MEIEVSRRQFFALFARAAHGAKNPKKCRGPCWPPAGVRPCASKERRGGYSDQRGAGVRDGIGYGRRGPPGMGCDLSAIAGVLARVYVGTSRGGRRRVSKSRRRYANWDGLSRAAHGRYTHGTAGGEAALRAERLQGCATRPSEEGGRLMMGINEKDERRELLDAVADAGRLARGLDQLLESLAHADQLDPLDVEGILALRSISERCAGRIGDPRASWRRRTRSFMLRGQEPVLSAARREGTLRSRRGSRRVARSASSILAGARNWGALDQLSPLMVSSSSAI